LTDRVAVPEPSAEHPDSAGLGHARPAPAGPDQAGPDDAGREPAGPEHGEPGAGGPKRARPAAVAVLVAAGIVAVGLDLLSKQLALSNLADGRSVRLLGGALYLTLTRNSGAAFSLAEDYTVVFPVIAFVVVGGIVWLAWRLRSVPWALAMGLILGGALGNLVDRMFRAPGPFRGHVVDFLSLFDAHGRVWPIFNVADSSLFCGVALAIVLELTGRRRDGTRHESDKRVTTAP
jgi:signal peptidase II